MNKLIFKLFDLKIGFAAFLVAALVFLAGCSLNISEPVKQLQDKAPNETAQMPKVYFCPRNDCGKALEEGIKSANYSVHCALYDINLENVISSLAAKSKEIDVKIVIDNSNYRGQLKGDGVRRNKNYKNEQLMHNKFCVIDGKIVATGSFNPTENDNLRNNNNFLIIHSRALAKNYEDEFDELWGGKNGRGNIVAHPVLYINNIRIENYFCPEDCQLESPSLATKDSGLYKIISLIGNAKNSVQVASFTFSNENIADELIRAQARGVNVTIVTESKQRNVQGAQYQRLKDFGLKIRLDGNKYNMHHKFMVVDGKVVVTGSPNFTFAGFNKNDENMVIIYDEGIALMYLGEFNAVYGFWN